MKKEEKLRVIDNAIKILKAHEPRGYFVYGPWMCQALSQSLSNEKGFLMREDYSDLPKYFPRFTQGHYILYHLFHFRFTPLRYLGDLGMLWDEPRETKRRIQFLEYLKRTI